MQAGQMKTKGLNTQGMTREHETNGGHSWGYLDTRTQDAKTNHNT